MHLRLILFALTTATLSSLLAAGAATVSAAEPVGDAGRGKSLFERRCAGCHSLDIEKEGPHLRGIYGRKAGTVATFAYSDSLKKSGIVWDEKTLAKWLQDSDDLVPDNDMSFRLPGLQPRADVIAYLKLVSQN